MSAVRPSVVGALLLALVAGGIAGFYIGRARTQAGPAPKAIHKSTEAPQHVLPAIEERRAVPDDPAALKELVVRQRGQIDTLAARVVELERQPQHAKPAQDRLAVAKEIYEAFMVTMKGMENGEGAGDYFKILRRLDELDESMVSFFVEKYRKAEGEEKELAQGLAICCGGREAAEFVKELLKNPCLGQKDRYSLLQGFALWGGDGIFPSKPLPVDSELAQMAFQLAESSDNRESSAGVSLLGHYDDPTSRAKLQQLANSNSDMGVRCAAIQALGKVGDRATLGWLQSLHPPDDSSLAGSLQSAIAKLKKKFPD